MTPGLDEVAHPLTSAPCAGDEVTGDGVVEKVDPEGRPVTCAVWLRRSGDDMFLRGTAQIDDSAPADR